MTLVQLREKERGGGEYLHLARLTRYKVGSNFIEKLLLLNFAQL